MSNFVIKSVSIPLEMSVFLDNNPEFSLSKIIQARLKELMLGINQTNNKIRVLENKLQILQQKLYEVNEENEKLKNDKP